MTKKEEKRKLEATAKALWDYDIPLPRRSWRGLSKNHRDYYKTKVKFVLKTYEEA